VGASGARPTFQTFCLSRCSFPRLFYSGLDHFFFLFICPFGSVCDASAGRIGKTVVHIGNK
jgi:hypothetical protein